MAQNVGDRERIVRALLGAALVLVALRGRRGRATRLSALLTGGELLYTAATRHCPANAAVDRDTASESEAREFAEMPA